MSKSVETKVQNVYEFDVCINKGVRYRTSERGKWIVIKKGPISAKEIAQVVVQAVKAYENMHDKGIALTDNMTDEEISKYFESIDLKEEQKII